MLIHTRHWLRLLLVCLFVAGLSPRAQAQYQSRFDRTIAGGVTFTGNTLGLSGGQQGQPGTNHSAGLFIARNRQAPGEVVGTTLDWRENGSGATLRLPADATVIHADLIWGGTAAVHDSDVIRFVQDPILLTLPSGRIVEIDPPDNADFYTTPGIQTHYRRIANVTNLVALHGAGEYIVGRVPGVLDTRSSDVAIGWTLAVVYTQPDGLMRRVDYRADFDAVEMGGANTRSIAQTFLPSCTAQPANARLLVSAMEGDSNPSGEWFGIRPSAQPADPLMKMSGPANKDENFFGSQITGDDGQVDTTGWFGDRNHNPFPVPAQHTFAGRQGWDITNISLAPWVNANTPQFTVQAESDGYDAIFMLALAAQQDALRDRPLTAVMQADNPSAEPGQVITYTTTITHPGTVQYDSLRLTGVISDALEFVAGSVVVDGVVQPDEDLETLVLGMIDPGATHVISFRARVRPTVSAQMPAAAVAQLLYRSNNCAGVLADTAHASNVVRGVYRPALQTSLGIVPFGLRTGDIATIELTVRHTVGTAAPAVTVHTPMPAGVTYVAGTTEVDGVSIDDIDGVMPFAVERALPGGLNVGDSRRIAYRVRIERGTAAVAATAFADIDGAGPEPAQQVNAVTPVDNREPPLHVHVFGPQIVTPGDLFTFTASVYNQTLDPINGLTMDFDLPAGVTFVPGPCPALPCTIPGLAPGAQIDMPVSFQVSNPFTGGSLTATARVRDAANNVLALRRATISILGRSRYFAEGASNEFFMTRFSVVNPTEAAQTVKFRFLREDGSQRTLTFELGARARRDVDPRNIFGEQLGAFSTVVESTDTIGVDRLMTWDGTGYGSSADNGIAAPSDTWYFAEGATGIFQLYYLLENPDPERASAVTVRYLTPGREPIVVNYDVAPNARLTIPVHEIAGLEQAEVSAEVLVTNGVRIVADRAMYKAGPGGQPMGAGHASTGSWLPSTSWYFGEGATGDFWDTFLLLANAGNAEAIATVRYQLPSGESFTKDYTVPANRRVTVVVDGEDARLAATPVAMSISSTQPIVAERAMWWPGPQAGDQVWSEAHAALGATMTASTWAVASGVNGGPAGDSTYLLISNASDSEGEVHLTVVLDNQQVVTRTFAIRGQQRLTVDMAQDLPETAEHAFSVIVQGVTPMGELPLVVERSHYSSPNGLFWSAGDVTLGTPVLFTPPAIR